MGKFRQTTLELWPLIEAKNCIFSSPEPLGSQGELIGWP